MKKLALAFALKGAALYALVDGRAPTALRYIGWTTRLDRRLRDHVGDARGRNRSHRCNWIRSIPDEPGLRVLAFCAVSDGPSLERAAIASFRRAGHRLVNGTEGGEGTPGYRFSSEAKREMSAQRKGRKLTAAGRAAISLAHRRPEAIAALRARILGIPLTKEHREAISNAMRASGAMRGNQARLGQKNSPVAIAATAAASRGRKHSEATRALLRLQKLGKPLSPQHRLAISLALRHKASQLSMEVSS